MIEKEIWIKKAEEATNHYLNLGDSGFDENMKAWFVQCNYEENTVTIGFPTQEWQKNERGIVHGGAIAGMFDTALGIVANFTAGENEATTTDMNITFIRPLELGDSCEIKVIIVKAGRSLIRQRAELTCKESGKLIATASGSWMPL